MSFIEKNFNKKTRLWDSLLYPKVVKFSALSAFLVWVIGIILAYLVAQMDAAGPGYDPAGNIFLINYISDLGSINYTPMPFILGFTLIGFSILIVPVFLYLRDVLRGDDSKKIRIVLSNATLICMFIALAGMFLTGLLSEDIGAIFDKIVPIGFLWHDITADFAFGFFMVSGILVAFQFVMFPDILIQLGLKNTKRAGMLFAINSWILTPVFLGFFYSVPYLDAVSTPFWTYLPSWQWAPFWEWLLMISISTWFLVLNLIIIKKLNGELKSINR